MKILIISEELWRNDINGGNVLSNIFFNIEAEYAQIYCRNGMPENNICKKYYQMTDSMMINNLIHSTVIGHEFELTEECTSLNNASTNNNRVNYNFFKKHRLSIFYIFQELLWKFAKWDNERLENFILHFQPDIIFAPCYGKQRMLRLTRYVANLTHVPIVSYISDDSYSLKRIRISPIYWINHFILRHSLRKTFSYYNLVYTMTEEQKQECERIFNANMKILIKGTDVPNDKKFVGKPIKLIFAGGIYCGRWKTLSKIVKALKKINKNSVLMELHIYTGSSMTKKHKKLLDDRRNSYLHEAVSQSTLKDLYGKSDIALHVESFDLKNRFLTRLSFSTKITDCLESGCAVMAIAWKNHSGLKYLQREDAAMCIDNPNEIYNTLNKICEDKEIILEYQKKAKQCCIKNHNKEKNSAMILADFERVIHENNEA